MVEAAKQAGHSGRGQSKSRVGTVVSNKMRETVVVQSDRTVQHPRYKKFYRKSRKFVAHAKDGQCNVGDRVRIVETRPLSKTKRWRMVEILKRAD